MKKWNAIGILIVLVIEMVFIGGCTRPVSTAPTPVASPTSQIVNETVPQQVTTPSVIIPPNGFWVKVTYSGTFSGVVGKPGLLKDVDDSGDHFYQISTTDGPVWVSIRKSDGSSAELAVDVYKDGALIKRAATTAPKGIVEFEASVKAVTTEITATPATPTPTLTTIASSCVEAGSGSLSIHTGGAVEDISVFITRNEMDVPDTYYDQYGYISWYSFPSSRFIEVKILPDGSSETVWLAVGNHTAYLRDKSGRQLEKQTFAINENSNTLISFLGFSYRISH
jgi:hypothetical protein